MVVRASLNPRNIDLHHLHLKTCFSLSIIPISAFLFHRNGRQGLLVSTKHRSAPPPVKDMFLPLHYSHQCFFLPQKWSSGPPCIRETLICTTSSYRHVSLSPLFPSVLFSSTGIPRRASFYPRNIDLHHLQLKTCFFSPLFPSVLFFSTGMVVRASFAFP